ncbi:MAG: hypothetical protein QOI13_1195, partial [Paraburkholderia sp.]|nr:hypothetical protein [Paraburkholderia sp.]
MLGRIVAGMARTGVGIGVGIAIDRAANLRGAKTTPALDPLAQERTGFRWGLLTGNQRLADAARQIAPQPGSSVLQGAVEAQVKKRSALVDKVCAIAADPRAAVGRLEKGVENIRDDVNTVRGATAVVSGSASLTKAEAAAIAVAVATDAHTGLYRITKAAVTGTFAAATTTQEGVQEVAGALTRRAERDIKQAAAGVAISGAIAAAVGAIPHPAAKVASAVISATGKLATGAQISESLRDVGGAPDAAGATSATSATTETSATSETKRAMGEILRTKIDNGA